jgi:arginine repressor
VLVADLATRGIKVAAAQVSQVLKKMGFRPLRKRRQGKKAAEGIAAKANVGASRSGQLFIDDLLMAKNGSGELSCTDKAIAVLRALKRFEG